MRQFNTADLFVAARVVASSGLKPRLKELMQDISGSEDALEMENIGIDTILAIMEVFTSEACEDGLYEILSGPFEMKPEDIPVLTVDALLENLEYLYDNGGLKNFFKRLSGMIGRKSQTSPTGDMAALSVT